MSTNTISCKTCGCEIQEQTARDNGGKCAGCAENTGFLSWVQGSLLLVCGIGTAIVGFAQGGIMGAIIGFFLGITVVPILLFVGMLGGC